jgi:hypothetical protein
MDVNTALLVVNLVLTSVVTIMSTTRLKCRCPCCGSGTASIDIKPKDAPASPPDAAPAAGTP